MTRFSIITPFYKGNQYVSTLVRMAESNLKSLCDAGIDAELELIIVNDSPEVSVELPSSIHRIEVVLINHEKNGGIQKARVTGLNKSKGDYIVFLDQDDEIVDDCILQEYNVIQDADVVVANLLFEPVAANLAMKTADEVLFKNIMIQGIVMIQSGANPRLIKDSLMTYLPPAEREALMKAEE